MRNLLLRHEADISWNVNLWIRSRNSRDGYLNFSIILAHQFYESCLLYCRSSKAHENTIEVGTRWYKFAVAICSAPDYIFVVVSSTGKNQTAPSINNYNFIVREFFDVR